MDLTISSTRTCASIPDHSLCLDYRVPALAKVFTKFLEQYPQITGYTHCSKQEPSTISCWSDSYKVVAVKEKIKELRSLEGLRIDLKKNDKDSLSLFCVEDECRARNHEGITYGFSDSEDGECFEFLQNPNRSKPDYHKVPCDGEASLLEEYLKQTSFILEARTAMPSPNAPNATGGPTPAPTPANPPAAPQPAPSSNSSSQKSTAFSTMQKLLGAAGTIFLAYKASTETKKKESGSRAWGYGAAAMAAGVITIYSMRA